jgi:hypothetical protein
LRDDFGCFVGWAFCPKTCIFTAGGTPHKHHPQIVQRYSGNPNPFNITGNNLLHASTMLSVWGKLLNVASNIFLAFRVSPSFLAGSSVCLASAIACTCSNKSTLSGSDRSESLSIPIMSEIDFSIVALEASLDAKIERYFDTLDTDPDVLKQLLADKRSENTRMRAVLFMVW